MQLYTAIRGDKNRNKEREFIKWGSSLCATVVHPQMDEFAKIRTWNVLGYIHCPLLQTLLVGLPCGWERKQFFEGNPLFITHFCVYDWAYLPVIFSAVCIISSHSDWPIKSKQEDIKELHHLLAGEDVSCRRCRPLQCRSEEIISSCPPQHLINDRFIFTRHLWSFLQRLESIKPIPFI